MYVDVIPEPTPAGGSARYVARVSAQAWTERTSRLGARLRSIDPWLIDGVLAVIFIAVALVGHFSTDDSGFDYRDPDVLSVALTLIAAAVYVFRRRAPLVVLVVSEICVVILTVREYQTGGTPTLLLVGVYTVGAWSPPRDRLVGMVTLAVGLGTVAITGIPGSTGANTAFTFALFAASYFVGSTVRNRRLYSEQLEARAVELE